MATSVPERVGSKNDLVDAELQLRAHRDEKFCEGKTCRDSDERHDSNFRCLDDHGTLDAETRGR